MTKNSHHTAGPLNTKGPYSGHSISSFEASYNPPDRTGKAQPTRKKVKAKLVFYTKMDAYVRLGYFEL